MAGLRSMDLDAIQPRHATWGSAKDRAAGEVSVRLLATSDIHVSLAPYDYFTDTETASGSLARIATLIAEARSEHANTLLFDNGDFLHGGLLGDFISLAKHDPNPIIQVMNEIGYDAANIGNHEFSNGVSALRQAMKDANFPMVSANTFNTIDGSNFAYPCVILDKRVLASDGKYTDLKVGVVGALPPQTTIWDQRAIRGEVRISDMVTATAQAVSRARREGADLVVVLAHCGIGSHPAPHLAEHAGLSIAGIDGVDALVLGHVHLPFPGPTIPHTRLVDPVGGKLNGVPTIMPGVFGSHLGVIDLVLHQRKTGWVVKSTKTSLRAVASRSVEGQMLPNVHPDQRLMRRITSVHNAARNWVRRPIARSGICLHSYFAMVTDVPAIQLIHRAQTGYVRERLVGTQWEDTPIVSGTAPFKAGGRAGPENYTSVPAGDLLIRHMADLYLYPNTIVALSVTGAELRKWLEHATRAFQTVPPGATDHSLLNLEVAPFHFDTVGGVTYEIDLSAPYSPAEGRSRIKNLMWKGQKVQDSQQFVLATNSYRASGSGGYFAPNPNNIILSSDRQCREVLGQYLRQNPPNQANVVPNWRFAPLTGTSVIFETSPACAKHLADVGHLDLMPLDVNAEGFLRMRMTL